jgi:hypothetical protein
MMLPDWLHRDKDDEPQRRDWYAVKAPLLIAVCLAFWCGACWALLMVMRAL